MNKDLQILLNEGEQEVVNIDGKKIYIISIDFERVLMDKSIKLSRRIKKQIATCGGGLTLMNVKTYSMKKNKFEITDYYVVRNAKYGDYKGTAKRFVLYHEIGHIVLGHLKRGVYGCNDLDLEREADKYAFEKMGIRKNMFFNSELIKYTISSYVKPSLFGYKPYSDKEKENMKKNLQQFMKQRFNLNVIEL